jgi:hypothetical protein
MEPGCQGMNGAGFCGVIAFSLPTPFGNEKRKLELPKMLASLIKNNAWLWKGLFRTIAVFAIGNCTSLIVVQTTFTLW